MLTSIRADILHRIGVTFPEDRQDKGVLARVFGALTTRVESWEDFSKRPAWHWQTANLLVDRPSKAVFFVEYGQHTTPAALLAALRAGKFPPATFNVLAGALASRSSSHPEDLLVQIRADISTFFDKSNVDRHVLADAYFASGSGFSYAEQRGVLAERLSRPEQIVFQGCPRHDIDRRQSWIADLSHSSGARDLHA